MRAAIEKLRRLADEFGGCETSDGLFLNGLADAIEHGDAMDELDGMALIVGPKGILGEAKTVIERLAADTSVALGARRTVLNKLSSAISATSATRR